MKLVIFGATGGTGKQFVKRALVAGNHVVTYVRNSSKLDFTHKNLRIVEGELDDKTKIEQSISSVDAVISILGPRRGSKEKPITRGMQNIITAMIKFGVRRLIISSTMTVMDTNDSPDLRQKF